jgi:hypothetical protein
LALAAGQQRHSGVAGASPLISGDPRETRDVGRAPDDVGDDCAEDDVVEKADGGGGQTGAMVGVLVMFWRWPFRSMTMVWSSSGHAVVDAVHPEESAWICTSLVIPETTTTPSCVCCRISGIFHIEKKSGNVPRFLNDNKI